MRRFTIIAALSVAILAALALHRWPAPGYAAGSFTAKTRPVTIGGPNFTACQYLITPATQSFPASGGNGNVSILTQNNCAWTATSNAPWITLTSANSGSGLGRINYSVIANTDANQRSGTITIAGQTFTVAQAGTSGNCAPIPISIGQTVNGALTTSDCRSPLRVKDGERPFADRYSFSGASGQPVILSLSSADFDTYLYLLGPDGSVIAQNDDGGSGSGSRIPAGSGFFTLAASGTFVIEVTSFSSTGLGNYTLSLTAPAGGCTYAINATSQPFPGGGGTGTVNVSTSAGCAWTAMSNNGWVRITAGSDGSGPGAVNYAVAANAAAARTGTMVIAGLTFTISQAGAVNPAPNLQFSAANYSASESAGSATITVTRSGETSRVSNVDFATSDGTGKQRTDYITAAGTLTFAPGEINKSFTILVVDNAYVDGNRTVNIALANPTGGTLGVPASVVLTILDNDSSPPTTNPLDNADAKFFVRQHYLDFLNREPDPDGLAYWSGQIAQCGSDQTCLRNKRIDVSNAFFFELEYQQTGAYVFRLYRAAYGNSQPFPNPNPDPKYPNEDKKLPSYAVFVADRARVVGGANLAQLQLDLANAFVGRPEFLTKYPANLTGSQFVDAVLATIQSDLGVDLSSRRTALNTLFNQGGRGAVLYRLADDNLQTNPIDNRAFIDAEYNRAFVATQYFGYLRRNADIGGFNFWLGQVSSAPLRDVSKQHAMVCSFTTSAEYQQRFSSVVTHSNTECQ